MKITNCRICKSRIVKIFSLGKIPPVNYYPSKIDSGKKEKKFPLNLCLCENCSLVQIDEMVPPEKLFSIYHYISSTSLPLKNHLENLARYCKKEFKLDKNSTVLDIGCNDGVLLDKFKGWGVGVLGVDPAQNIAKHSRKKNIEVISDFFSYNLAKKIKNKHISFDLITSTNTFGHIIDVDDFLKGIKILLSSSGVFVIEVGYILDMILKKNFDSIYHEHVSFFSLGSLGFLLDKHNLEVFDSEHIDMHGGSLRIFMKHKENINYKKTLRLKKLLNRESEMKLDRKESYEDFADFVNNYGRKLKSYLIKLKRKNKRIVGWGAPAKCVVILNYCEIDNFIMDYVIDSTGFKQNRNIPGVKIPVYSEEKIKEDKPDYLILFIWTYKEFLTQKINEFKDLGIKIIVPFPKIEII